MDANMQQTPKITKESKRKIRVEFERTPLKERLKAKFMSSFFFQKVIWYIFRLVLLIGISYVVLYPFISKIAGSFMSPTDFTDVTVRLIPKEFTLDTYKSIITELNYFEAFGNTLLLSLGCAVLQTFICCLIAYGLAKFRFRGGKIVMALVILTMIVPHQTLRQSMFEYFRYFDVCGILSLLSGGASVGIEGIDAVLANIHVIDLEGAPGIQLNNTFLPLFMLSATGLAFKNGLYIFMLRQFFTGVPDALEESAYIDGSGVIRTFFTIILPLSVPMMVTVFLFACCWQWTDYFYTEKILFMQDTPLMSDIALAVPASRQSIIDSGLTDKVIYDSAVKNTGGILIILPLVILFIFCQNFLVQGIERSGLTAD